MEDPLKSIVFDVLMFGGLIMFMVNERMMLLRWINTLMFNAGVDIFYGKGIILKIQGKLCQKFFFFF